MKLLSCTALFAAIALTTNVAHGKLRVTATTTIVADLVRQVGGDRVEIEALMGAGVDPHLYKASASDVTKLSRAEVIFYSGLFLEGRMDDVLKGLARRSRKVFAVAEAVPAEKLIRPAQFQGHPDPHVWGDPELWKKAVDAVAQGLIEADPSGTDGYRARAQKLRDELDQLREWALKRVSEVPANQRVLITSHDAFNYFGIAFGFEVVGVQGISTVTEAGLADIAKVVDLVRERRLKAVFVESSVSPATIERISKDSGARIGGELFSDALGKAGDVREVGGERYDVGTYVGMLKHNVNTVVEALK